MLTAPAMRAPAAFALSVTLVACGTPGDRVAWFSEGCPKGEICSSKTPYGLYLSGSAFDRWDGPVAPTVVGGAQTISAQYSGGFTAALEDEAILALGPVLPPTLQLRGVSAGSTRLRLRDPGSGELLDRFTLDAREVTAIELVPWSAYSTPTCEDGPQDVVMLAGSSTIRLGARVWGGDERLADESLQVSQVNGTVLKKAEWDLFVFEPATQGTYELAATSGGRAFSSKFDVVPGVDEVRRTCTNSHSYGTSVCFEGTNAGRRVEGAVWAFEVSQGFALGLQLVDRCAWVRTTTGSGGTATLTVTAANLTTSFAVEVATPGPDDPGASEPLQARRAAAGTPGERASRLDAR